MVFDEVDLNGH